MAHSGSLAYHSRPSDSEKERIRELSRYYCCTNQQSPSPTATIVEGNNSTQASSSISSPTGDEQPSAGILPTDITLTALAQLGVLRLKCNRSFVSLIDGENQHIIAEATASISIRDKDKHLPDDGIYLGVRTLDLVWGVCPHTIRLFTAQDTSYEVDTENVTANRTRYIIRDFTKEDCFKDRPYVLEWPHMRFYAEVPLVSPSGYVLGSYCVVDDQPRADFREEDVDTLQEISDAIASHLENKRIAHYHSRFERLVTGLTDFSKDQPDFDPRSSTESLIASARSTIHELPIGSPSALNDTETTAYPFRRELGDRTLSGSHSISTIPTDPQHSPVFFVDKPFCSTEPSSLSSNVSLGRPSPGEEKSITSLDEAVILATKIVPQNESLVSLPESLTTLDRICGIFSRASELLRDAMNLDGVVFLDASKSRSPFTPQKDHTWEPLPKTASQLEPDTIASCPTPFLPEKERASKSQCDVLGQSLKTGVIQSEVIPDEDLLEILFKTCPQGQVVNLDISPGNNEQFPFESAFIDSSKRASSAVNVANLLGPLLPDAKSVVWLPLWDHQKSRWMAGMLSWSSDGHRGLGVEELHYFKVFADSIVSEVSRVNWISTEKSKFDLLSSLSHELRSPLHGILASTELLHGTSINAAQEEIVRMIETSGLTLLETTDHLLAYCKINNSTRDKQRGENHENDLLVLETDFDLGQLVEEVTDILYTGQKDSSLASRTTVLSPSASVHSGAEQICSSEKPSVVVRIDQSLSWKIRSLPGAWRRIVMNILGNSLKWTARGLIEISLSMLRNPEEPGRPLAHVSIIDTGRGIAPDFLKHDLFTPFAQEDRLVEGVGLGLSIVRQLVTSLSGHINVRSQLGFGTQVDIYIPVHHLNDDGVEKLEGSPALSQNPQPVHASLVAFNGYPEIGETPTGMLTVEAKRKLSIQSMLADVFMSNPNWKVSLVESIDKGQGDIAVLEGSSLQMNEPGALESLAANSGFKFLIILKSKTALHEKLLPSKVVWVSPPFGPRKIQKAIEKVLKLRQLQSDIESDLSVVQLTLPDQPVSPLIEKASVNVETTTALEIPIELPQSVGSLQDASFEQPRHVLVVDDNDINLKIMATFMRKVGCTYDTASNGLIALEKYRASDRRYDYVLMDISMPVMDGLVSTSKIRQFEKEKRHKPACIMAVTGVASDTMQQQALAAGVDRYLIKPLSLRELKKLII